MLFQAKVYQNYLFFNAKERKGKRKGAQIFFEIQVNKILHCDKPNGMASLTRQYFPVSSLGADDLINTAIERLAIDD